jgi:hypothetical protein
MMLLLLSHYYHYITLSDAMVRQQQHLTVLCNDNGEKTAAASDSVM